MNSSLSLFGVNLNIIVILIYIETNNSNNKKIIKNTKLMKKIVVY